MIDHCRELFDVEKRNPDLPLPLTQRDIEAENQKNFLRVRVMDAGVVVQTKVVPYSGCETAQEIVERVKDKLVWLPLHAMTS